ncbi:hypothetical protein NliqN6_2802 [Naganishia liquefaciens]|uniref:Uncharacterized protein n=1 Tax=Naganishia liquefaciens TaxID=104408 RepID=A0A8H3TTJ0_9TREE|nr:hypothetical protein NliqN6_2802 [Naganishia liquefaciens]
MDRGVSYYGPVFPTTPGPGSKDDEERTPLLTQLPSAEVLASTEVYPLIHLIRVDVTSHIDTPLTIDQLHAPDSTYTIVRPLTEKYSSLQNHAIIFCLLLNRVQFLKDASQLSINTLSLSRANLCEMLAIRVLRGWSERTLPLASLLLTPWALFQGASKVVIDKVSDDYDDDTLVDLAGNALEMAILGNAKRFIRSPSAQKVIEGIWSGRIVYHAVNQYAIIADDYKKRPIQIYNPHKAPLLDHYRLKVPRIRSILEYFNFAVLFVLYVLAIEGLNTDRFNWREMLFIVYAMGFSLDKLAAMREHGLRVFAANLWNGFDLGFIVIYLTYLSFRIYGLKHNQSWAREFSTDVLAIGAVGMFPRLAFVTLSNNLMILSLRSMMGEFIILMGIASFCFLGFSYALWTLGRGRYQFSQIGWYLLEVYFGLDASGFEAAHDFHRYLGPILMISFACLSNTLLLTVLVAILSNTFATINADAAAESMFRKAVSTLEGVKGDSVFSYQLPFNLVAVVFMWPLSYVLSRRWFHKVNVFMIRLTSFPILLAIAIYERQKFHHTTVLDWLEKQVETRFGSAPRKFKNALIDSTGFDSFAGAGKDIYVVFEVEREVGDYYAGWDDDVDIDGDRVDPDRPRTSGNSSGDEDDETTIKASQPIQIAESPNRNRVMTPDEQPSPRDAHVETSIPFPRSNTVDATSKQQQKRDDGPSRRRQSTPATSRQVAVAALGGADGLLANRRRRESIVEPSPLARLFVRSPTEESAVQPGIRRHIGSLSMSLAHPSHLVSNAFNERLRQRRRSLARADDPDYTNGLATVPIKEGQPSSFRQTVGRDEHKTSPTVDVKPDKDHIANATAVEDAEAGAGNVVIDERLAAIEGRQRRIEELLQQILQASQGGPDYRRESAISMEL